MSTATSKIEVAFRREDWQTAQSLIKEELRLIPNHHWLLTRLATTYYEQRKYKRALTLSEKAFALAPRCPLVLWDYAGALDMLGRTQEAIKIFRSLTRSGAKRIAFGQCGEGMVRARGLVADCYYRLALCSQTLGQTRDARKYLRRHLALRGPGCHSIYPVKKVRSELEDLSIRS